MKISIFFCLLVGNGLNSTVSAFRARQWICTGHCSQAGFFGVQTRAPSSIRAWLYIRGDARSKSVITSYSIHYTKLYEAEVEKCLIVLAEVEKCLIVLAEVEKRLIVLAEVEKRLIVLAEVEKRLRVLASYNFV